MLIAMFIDSNNDDLVEVTKQWNEEDREEIAEYFLENGKRVSERVYLVNFEGNDYTFIVEVNNDFGLVIIGVFIKGVCINDKTD